MEEDGSIVGEIFGEISYFRSFFDSQELLGGSILILMKRSKRLRIDFGHAGFLLATIMPYGILHLDFHPKKYEPPSPYYFI